MHSKPCSLKYWARINSCFNVCILFEDGDHLVGNYRSHALALSVVDEFKSIVLELLAKREGVSGGKAGSMHLSVPSKNMMWTSAIVGTGVPIATGIAEALKRQSKKIWLL